MKEDFMSWERCKKGFVRKVDVDKINALTRMMVELNVVNQVSFNSSTASKFAKDFYEIIKGIKLSGYIKIK